MGLGHLPDPTRNGRLHPPAAVPLLPHSGGPGLQGEVRKVGGGRDRVRPQVACALFVPGFSTAMEWEGEI